MADIEVLFYRNRKGDVAVSLDDGETVWTPQGRNIPMTPAWEWADEDGLELLLTPHQVKAIEDARNAPPLTEIEELVLRLHKRQLAVRKDYYQPPPPPRRVRTSQDLWNDDCPDRG